MRINGKEVAQGTNFEQVIAQLELLPSGFNLAQNEGFDANLDPLLLPIKREPLPANLPQAIQREEQTLRDPKPLMDRLKALYRLSVYYRADGNHSRARECLIELKNSSAGKISPRAIPILQRNYAIVRTPAVIGTNSVFECIAIVVRDQYGNFGLFHADRDNLAPANAKASLDAFFAGFRGNKNVAIYGGEKGPNDDQPWNKAKSNREEVVKYLLGKRDVNILSYDVKQKTFPRAALFSIQGNEPFSVATSPVGQPSLQQGLLQYAQAGLVTDNHKVVERNGAPVPFLWKSAMPQWLKVADVSSEEKIENFFLKMYGQYGESVESEITAAKMAKDIFATAEAAKHAKASIVSAVIHKITKKPTAAHIFSDRDIHTEIEKALRDKDYFIGTGSANANTTLVDTIVNQLAKPKTPPQKLKNSHTPTATSSFSDRTKRSQNSKWHHHAH